MGQRSSIEPSSSTPTSSANELMTGRLLKKLKPVERHALKQTFDELKTVFSDGFQCLEEPAFVKYLELPNDLAVGGSLLYKIFIALASYPSFAETGPVPLSETSLAKALALLCGKAKDIVPENELNRLIFDSIAVVHSSPPYAVRTENPVIGEKTPEQMSQEEAPHQPSGLGLKDLGISFEDREIDEEDKTTIENTDSICVRCSDLTELLTILLWISESRSTNQTPDDSESSHKHSFSNECRSRLAFIVQSFMLSRVNRVSTPECEELLTLDWATFSKWYTRNAPNLFDVLAPFLYEKFLLGNLTALSPKMIEAILPKIDESDILTPFYTTLLTWALPTKVVHDGHWHRLYSGEKHGFSMNRFEKHVFQYPGPTLLLVMGEIKLEDTRSSPLSPTHPSSFSSPADFSNGSVAIAPQDTRVSPNEGTILIAAYIPSPWQRSSKSGAGWAGSDTLLIELAPHFEVFPTSGSTADYIHCDMETGIRFGGSNKPKLHSALPTSRRSSSQDSTPPRGRFSMNSSLQAGTFVDNLPGELDGFVASEFQHQLGQQHSLAYYFEILEVEVFGLAGEDARRRQLLAWEFEQREAERRASTRQRRADTEIEREILAMAGIIDRENISDHR
ncbi:uncharacterized protein VTP21DRAFT_8417 [Calcarisporiella thermophila]|uniref:uncharacterized protein n=1 Tax=Calcarisporiella thermophila TaxID=911321 RepID=UPI0037441BD8